MGNTFVIRIQPPHSRWLVALCSRRVASSWTRTAPDGYRHQANYCKRPFG